MTCWNGSLLNGASCNAQNSTPQQDVLNTIIKLRVSKRLGIEIRALPGCYAASSGNLLPTFRDNLSVPSARITNALGLLAPKMWRIGCPETSIRNYRYKLCNIPEERRSHLIRDGSLKSGWELSSGFTNISFSIVVLLHRQLWFAHELKLWRGI